MADYKIELYLLKHDAKYKHAYIQIYIVAPFMACIIAFILTNIIQSLNIFVYYGMWIFALLMIYIIDYKSLHKNIHYIQHTEKRATLKDHEVIYYG